VESIIVMRRGVAALAVAVVLAPLAPVGARGATPTQISGVSLMTHNSPPAVTQVDIPRIAGTGVSHLGLDATLVVPSPTSVQVNASPVTTPTDLELRQAMARAAAEGLKTTFTIKFRVEGASNPGNNSWRGYYQPADLDAFWKNYRAQVLHYAWLAQQGGVDIFFVGSEMNWLEQYTARWRALIADVRLVFKGRVSYEMNWDVFLGRSPSPRVAFWDALDLISVSAYFPLSTAERPTVEELRAGWNGATGHNWVAQLAALSTAWRRPILFGEAGYLASTYAAREPWDENVVEKDPAVQARGYLALLETFSAQPWFAGVLWWDWNRANAARSIHDKPAEELLRQWYRDGLRPGMPSFDPERAPGPLAFATYEQVPRIGAQTASVAAATRLARANVGAQSPRSAAIVPDFATSGADVAPSPHASVRSTPSRPPTDGDDAPRPLDARLAAADGRGTGRPDHARDLAALVAVVSLILVSIAAGGLAADRKVVTVRGSTNA
jgi:hypothetical protein